MSADLDDLKRLKVTRRTQIWLAAKSRTTGRPKQVIARDALDRIAAQEIHEANVLASMAAGEASTGAIEDLSRDSRGRTS